MQARYEMVYGKDGKGGDKAAEVNKE